LIQRCILDSCLLLYTGLKWPFLENQGLSRKKCLLLSTFVYLSCLTRTGFVLNQALKCNGCVTKVYKTAPEVCKRDAFWARYQGQISGIGDQVSGRDGGRRARADNVMDATVLAA
jgi:hypothetical protein